MNNQKSTIKIFEEQKVRSLWDDETEQWYFSIVDVVVILTDSVNPTAYWRKLKQRLKNEGNQTVTDCHGFKMMAPDGKMRMTDCVGIEPLFRLIQSIPSPKAEPFKLWMAQIASERLDQLQDPELSTKEISVAHNPDTFEEHKETAEQGGNIARNARLELEAKTGKKIISQLNSKDGIELDLPDTRQEIENKEASDE